MPLDVDPAPVRGVWFRHVPAGGAPLYRPEHPGSARWQRGEVVEGFYLAGSEETTWAEWYRSLAELALPPTRQMPRDLCSFAARSESFALCLFRSGDDLAGVRPVPPPIRHVEPPGSASRFARLIRSRVDSRARARRRSSRSQPCYSTRGEPRRLRWCWRCRREVAT